MVKLMRENDYSETDEFTLIKEMNHWINYLKKFFVDDKKAQKVIADYFYYDDGAHQEDFKELQSTVKTLRKLWNKLDAITEDAEEKEYKEKNKKESYKGLKEQNVEIEVKHEGILEVPEGKNVDDLPMSHFEKLAKKKGLGKITKALNNLQVWNKNDDPKLSKWAGDMIDKLNKKLKKDESINRNKYTVLLRFTDGFSEELDVLAADEHEAVENAINDFVDTNEWGYDAPDIQWYDVIESEDFDESLKENKYGYVHDEDEAKIGPGLVSYLRKTGWIPINIDGKRYYQMDFNYGNMFCDIYIDEWGNCYLVTDNDDLRPSDMFYTITETNTDVIDDLITLGNTVTSTGDVNSALNVFFG